MRNFLNLKKLKIFRFHHLKFPQPLFYVSAFLDPASFIYSVAKSTEINVISTFRCIDALEKIKIAIFSGVF